MQGNGLILVIQIPQIFCPITQGLIFLVLKLFHFQQRIKKKKSYHLGFISWSNHFSFHLPTFLLSETNLSRICSNFLTTSVSSHFSLFFLQITRVYTAAFNIFSQNNSSFMIALKLIFFFRIPYGITAQSPTSSIFSKAYFKHVKSRF